MRLLCCNFLDYSSPIVGFFIRTELGNNLKNDGYVCASLFLSSGLFHLFFQIFESSLHVTVTFLLSRSSHFDDFLRINSQSCHRELKEYEHFYDCRCTLPVKLLSKRKDFSFLYGHRLIFHIS